MDGGGETTYLSAMHIMILTCGCRSHRLLPENIYFDDLLPKSDIVIIILVRWHHQLDGETCKRLIYHSGEYHIKAYYRT